MIIIIKGTSNMDSCCVVWEAKIEGKSIDMR